MTELRQDDSFDDKEVAAFRSPFLINTATSAVICVDLQEKLLPVIQQGESVERQSRLLLEGATILGVGCYATEQYPTGLGETMPSVGNLVPNDALFEKRFFSVRQCRGLIQQLLNESIRSIILCGIETHICVQQSAFDLIAAGFDVHLAVDATGSRSDIHRVTALARMQAHGVVVTTVETVLFEWCETSTHPRFRDIAKLVK